MTRLVVPTLALLPDYEAALRRGWSSDNTRDIAAEELERIARDPAAFIASLDDPEARAGDIVLPDGSRVKRLPSFQRWIWDDEFCGVIGIRWQEGTAELPPAVLGHIGFAVTPWKQRKGHATEALRLLLPLARARGLAYVELTTKPENIPSQRVIEANGGKLMWRIERPAQYGGGEALLYRIDLG